MLVLDNVDSILEYRNRSGLYQQGVEPYRQLFDRQFKRLSPLQQQITYWLAINREGVTARFSPDGQFIVSGSCDRTLKLWDVLTGQCDQTLTGHSELIYTLLVASVQPPDETSARLTALSGSLDESIKLWDLQEKKCWQTLRTSRPYKGMKIDGIQGLTDAQWATLNALGAAPIS